ncbi:ABC transporter permease subunit [Streptomyces sp. 4N509B]|uniref:ABC transporter permease subunit n=1 Tax=Streptomyces sp. 4N509B TaxID=3457413 RepID=UPI003FCEF9AC
MRELTAAVPAELIKLRTLRSTGWTLAACVATGAVVGALAGLSYRDARPGMTAREQAEYNPLLPSLYGLTLAQLALVVLGVLALGGEFTGGTIRPSLLAMPRRGRFYAAKLLAVTALAAPAALLTVVATYASAQATLGPYGADAADGRTLRAVAAGWLYLTLMCVFAAGLSALLRGTTRALAVLLPLLFLGSQGLGNAPVARTVLQYLPDQAGMHAMRLWDGADDRAFVPGYGPGVALAVVALWTAAALLGGHAVLRRADAP